MVAVSVDGGQNAPTGDPSGPDTEVMLDIEVAGAVAPGARIVVYFAPNTDAGFLDAISQAAMDTVNKPSVLSISWGRRNRIGRRSRCSRSTARCSRRRQWALTVCVACGDNGSDDGVGDGNDHVDFPASSPYSLACGGTKLTISGSSISSEVVWNEQRQQRRRDRWRRERNFSSADLAGERQRAVVEESQWLQGARPA